ncbi:hypothetical protein BDZ89DRAFT_909476, partial [Hymenopellis radicata]
MSAVNASTGFSGFELRMGRVPRIIPPMVPDTVGKRTKEAVKAEDVISKLLTITAEAQDNMIRAKVDQASFANRHRKPDWEIKTGDLVMLSTFHRKRDYVQKKDGRVAK